MLIVTGASGQLGRRIIDRLLVSVPAERIGASVRDPEALADLAAKGVRVRHGDFTDMESLRHAFEGAERILLVSSNAAASGGDPIAQHRNAIDVAKEIGVTRVLYTSQVSSSPVSHFPPGRTHAATEAMLAESGLKWTAMRHGFYAASALAMNSEGLKAGILATPQDGKVAWTTHDDLAAADAVLLAGEAEIDGPTPVLTSTETADLADLAELASQVLGEPVRREVLSDEAFRKRARSNGMPDGQVEFAMGYYRAARAGEFAATDPTLARLIDREPQTMRHVLKERLRRR